LNRRAVFGKVARIKNVFASLLALAQWLLNLFDPPPLKSMTLSQKAGRIFLLTFTLLVGSVLFAMVGAVGLFIMERGRELRDTPQFYHGLLIIFVGMAVNAGCIFILLQIKKADTKLVPPKK
jgi:hypothetical protein